MSASGSFYLQSIWKNILIGNHQWMQFILLSLQIADLQKHFKEFTLSLLADVYPWKYNLQFFSL